LFGKFSNKKTERAQKMVLSKMYCSEQIVIPEKISNLLKTYAKGKNAFFIFISTSAVKNKAKKNVCEREKNALKAETNAFQFREKYLFKHFAGDGKII
jgi:hypothetical protein